MASNELWDTAKEVIPLGVQTLSKAPWRYVNGVFPKMVISGKGCYMNCADDPRKYIDYVMGLGPILLGYCFPPIDYNVIHTLTNYGNLFSLEHPFTIILAEHLRNIIPCAEQVRFCKNGSDATEGAVRIARAYSGKYDVAYCGYHGYHDWYACEGELNRGIPPQNKQLMHRFTWNNLDSLKTLLMTLPIGTVICEVPPEDSQEQHGFLKDAIELAHKYDAVFILDEVVTGFRYSMSGAMGLLGVVPDMACFSKGMGNGYPIAAICGKKEIMQVLGDGAFFSSTFAGELVGISAAIAVIDFMHRNPVIEHIWKMGDRLRDGMQSVIDDKGLPIKLWGNAPRTIIRCYDKEGKESNELKSLFLQEMCKRGVFMGVPTFISYSHTADDIDRTVDAFNGCSDLLVRAVDEGTDKFMEGDYIDMKGLHRYWK